MLWKPSRKNVKRRTSDVVSSLCYELIIFIYNTGRQIIQICILLKCNIVKREENVASPKREVSRKKKFHYQHHVLRFLLFWRKYYLHYPCFLDTSMYARGAHFLKKMLSDWKWTNTKSIFCTNSIRIELFPSKYKLCQV